MAGALKEGGVDAREVICRRNGVLTEVKVIRPACRSGRECTAAILSELKRLTDVQLYAIIKSAMRRGKNAFAALSRCRGCAFQAMLPVKRRTEKECAEIRLRLNQ